MTNIDIAHLIGIAPYHPDRYLGRKAVGLPMQSVLSIYKHLTWEGHAISIGYKSMEQMEADRKQFEGLVGDNASLRSLGSYKGSTDFTLEVTDDST